MRILRRGKQAGGEIEEGVSVQGRGGCMGRQIGTAGWLAEACGDLPSHCAALHGHPEVGKGEQSSEYDVHVLSQKRNESDTSPMHVENISRRNESYLMAVSEFPQRLDVAELGGLQAEAGSDRGKSVLLGAPAAVEEDDCEGVEGVGVAEGSRPGQQPSPQSEAANAVEEDLRGGIREGRINIYGLVACESKVDLGCGAG